VIHITENFNIFFITYMVQPGELLIINLLYNYKIIY